MGAERVRIEKVFGVARSRFLILHIGFRGDIQWLPVIFRLAMVFVGEIMREFSY